MGFRSEGKAMKRSIIIQELEKIRTRHGGAIAPAVVVRAAEPKDSPLHSCFEWNNGKAAREYRLWQARQLIRVCVVSYPELPGKSTRMYVSLRDDRGREGYREAREVLRTPDYRKALLREAKREMEFFVLKYGVLKELAGVIRAMRRVSA
jgi:hypothetical protein